MENQEFFTQELKAMFVDVSQKRKIENGTKPAPRAVFRKQHGVVLGKFKVLDILNSSGMTGNLDGTKLGMFTFDKDKSNEYECILRFSSDTDPNSADIDTTIGVGLKIYGIDVENEYFTSPNADLIFQNINRFFAKDSQQMYEFTKSSLIDKNLDEYLAENKDVNKILDEMAHHEGSCLDASYFAILPFKFAENYMVKYRLRPVLSNNSYPTEDKNYLQKDLHQRLLINEYKFILEAQIRSLDLSAGNDLQVAWEDDFIPFAEITLEKQDTKRRGIEEFGDYLNFNCWRVPTENLPFGSIAETRRDVYKYGAETRYDANGWNMEEPKQSPCPYHRAMIETDADNVVVSAAIYPSIGVTRVGNSEEYFIGPLVPEPDVKKDENFYRDSTGKLKRQAAEFRIYGLNAKGIAIKELTADPDYEIEWSCHLANQKAAWYQFQLALDVPEASKPEYLNSFKRNVTVTDRQALIIDGGKQSISKNGDKVIFKDKFYQVNEDVYLGEMFFETESNKRLTLLGGKGVAKNINKEIAITFANNDGWYDDISDGPVTAKVKYQDKELTVQPAWVICAPPDYAPMQKSVRTMWDLMRDLAVSNKMIPKPLKPSFTDDIYPVFKRMTDLQWVNAGFAKTFGTFGAYDFSLEDWILKLKDGSNENQEFRRQMFNQFRQFELPGSQSPALWPWLYGDSIEIPAEGSPRQHCTLSKLQLDFLCQWVDGDFIDDWDKKSPKLINPIDIDSYLVEQQPDILTKAAMDFCLADAFHPGCEMTWPVRQPSMYMSAFRFKHDNETKNLEDSIEWGPLLTPSIVTAMDNPFQGQVAGGITRWMAIPWQTDTSSCRDGYDVTYDTYVPTFWPARVPNNILGYKQYLKLTQNKDENTILQDFNYRKEWLEDLPGTPTRYSDYKVVINTMIEHFDSVGIVLPKNIDIPTLPKTIQVAMPRMDVFIANHLEKGKEQDLKDLGITVLKNKINDTLKMVSEVKESFIKPGEKVVTIQEKFRERFK